MYQKLSDIVVSKKYKVSNKNHQPELLHDLQHEHNVSFIIIRTSIVNMEVIAGQHVTITIN